MQKSPLQLESYFVKNLSFSTRDGYEVKPGVIATVEPPALAVNFRAGHQEHDSLRWRVEIRVELNEDPENKFPYTMSVSLVGFFKVNERYPVEKVEALAKINGPAVLYSAARELIALITGRGAYPGILLPTVNFIPSPNKPKLKSNQPIQQKVGKQASKRAGSKKSASKV